jgi:hypothetical protein
MKLQVNLQRAYLLGYKTIGFGFLVSMVLGIAVYAFFLAFYSLSTSWAAPLTLSPAQEKVLAYQPQVANLRADLDKQRIELATAQATVIALSKQARHVYDLIARLNATIGYEAAQLDATSKAIDSALADKRLDIHQTERSTADVNKLLRYVDSELAAGLITSDQAAARRVGLQAALNAATDARAQAIQLQEQSRQLRAGAATLRGGSSSLVAIASVKQAIDLTALSTQIEIQLVAATETAKALVESIAAHERVLFVAQAAPQFEALSHPVTVLFMPYDNVKRAELGEPIFDCYLSVIACRQVGTIEKLYEAEEYARHPLFKTDLKGRLVGVKFTVPEAAKSQVVFVGGKPLFL